MVAILGACQASTAGASHAPAASGTASSGATGSPTIAPSTCVAPQTPGDRPQPGNLLGKLDRGRILFGIEGAGGTASGTFAYAVIDASGLHVTTTDDWTMARAIWAPGGGILFDSSRNDDRHLFRSALDGSSLVQLTNDLRGAEYAAAFIGPDHLVFTHWSCSDERDLGLHTANADGSGIADLTPDHPVGSPLSDDQPTVSPDGRTIVFVRYSVNDDSAGGLFSVPATGGTATRLTPDATGTSYPRFSPDGRWILFTQQVASGDEALWLEPATGGQPRQLTSLPAGTAAFEADWSPDGSEIVTKEHQPTDGPANELHVLKADGTGDQLLWRGKLSTAESPDWGP
ncbi:MAG TPA: hypothetical protein VFP19_05650 [Candidatus Limnocylindrales bacterium]|nr:hypothetical protein [Candidatus Limnocylindrales bacterium]